MDIHHTIPPLHRTDNVAVDVLTAAQNDLKTAANRLRALAVADDVVMDDDLLTVARYLAMSAEDAANRIGGLCMDHRERVYKAVGIIS